MNCVDTKSPYKILKSPDPEIKLLKCKWCGLIRVDKFLNQKNLKEIWDNEHGFPSSYVSGEDWRRKKSKKLLKWITSYIKPEGPILDIGCAGGFFLDEAEKIGFKSFGIDTSPVFVKYIENRFSPLISVKQGNFSDEYIMPNFFNVITCFDTIGYSTDPGKDLRKIYSLLNKGGYLFMSNLLSNKLIHTKKELLSFNYYFDVSTINLYLKASKFSDIKSYVEPKNLNTTKKYSFKWFKMNIPILNRNDVKMIMTVARKK
jgi:SAM-dependent methyltransferase